MMLRLFQEEDLQDLIALDKEVFISSWNEEMFLYEYKNNPFAKLYVLVDQNQILGYIDYWLLGDQCQLSRIAISNKFQKKGYGSILMNQCIKDSQELGCRNINLEVRVSNQKAIYFYQHFGFVVATVRKQYYSDTNEDAYLMIKEMEGSYVTDFSD